MGMETIRIRRYPNRRLYDRTRRCYVTLQDIESIVREGHTIEVEDSKTGEDLTRQVLAQILLERHPEKMDLLFPASVLHSILQANDMAMEFWRGCLRQSLTALEGWQKRGMGATAPMSWMSALFPFSGFLPASAQGSSDSTSLINRVAELESRIARLESGESEEGSQGSVTEEAVPGGEHAGGARDEAHLKTLESRVRRLERPGRGTR